WGQGEAFYWLTLKPTQRVAGRILKEIKGDPLYQVRLATPDFLTLKSAMKEAVLAWTQTEKAFEEAIFVETYPDNQTDFLSVTLTQAGSVWRALPFLNILDHFVDYLTSLEILHPGSAEAIFKSLLQVEKVRVEQAAQIINASGLPEDEAFALAGQASYEA